jgi:hypothetical protein
MVSGLSGADLESACVAKLNVDPAQVKAVIGEARKQLTLAAEYNRNEMLGTALTRLNDIYARCIRAGADGNGPNLAKALDVQKEINRLAGLYPDSSAAGQSDGIGTQAGDDDLELLGSAAEALSVRQSDGANTWRATPAEYTAWPPTRTWRRARPCPSGFNGAKYPILSPCGTCIVMDGPDLRIGTMQNGRYRCC